MTEISRGSEWRKRDLHIHTPLSICQDYGGDKDEVWEKFIASLENLPDEVKVIGINDYYFIEGYERVMLEKQKGRLKNIEKIFPILEFRIDTFASASESKFNKINLHVLFDLDESKLGEEIKTLKDEFLGHITLTSQHATEKLSIENFQKFSSDRKVKTGFAELIPSTEKVIELTQTKQWQSKTFTILGYNERNNLEKSVQLKQKKQYLYSVADAFFTASEADDIEKKEQVLGLFRRGEIKKPLLHSGDIHNFSFLDTYQLSESLEELASNNYYCYTWVKANPTFEGLKQIIYEPEDRVKIQPIKPSGVSQAYHIDYVEYFLKGKKEFVYLNPFLTSIIGVRASGKSTLLKNIVKSVDIDEFTRREENSDIFNLEDLKVFWGDGKKDGKTILYIPQNYLSELVHGAGETKKDLKNFIKDLFERNEEFKNLLYTWQKSNEVITQRISQIVSDIFSSDEKYLSKKLDAKNEGDKDSVEDKIKNLKKDIKETRKKSKVSDTDLKEYNKNQKRLIKTEEDLTILERDRKSLEFLQDLDIVDKDILNNIQISDIIEQKVTKQLNDKEESISVFLVKEIEKLKGKIKDKKKDVATEEKLIAPYKEKIKKESLLTELLDQLTRQEKKLNRIKKIAIEIIDLEVLRKKKRDELVTEYNKREIAINKLIKDFKSFGKKFEFIDIKLEKFFKEDDLKNIRRSFNISDSKNKTNYKLIKFFENIEILTNSSEALLEAVNGIICGDILLRKGEDEQSFINRLLGNYYDVNYQDAIYDKRDGTKLLEMSDGQKMNALLELLFSFDDYNFPILIDQPEDDLDVTAITKHVSRFIRKKKESRQIIIVSHNANLVMGSDSENIIVADKKTEKGKIEGFQYVNGAIEDQSIRSEIISILEGGRDAFMKRQEKLEIY